MPKANWLGRMSAHLWRLGNRRGRSSRDLQRRQRRGGSHYSAIPAMIEVMEPRRVLSASASNLAFVQDSAVPGMMMVHGHISGTVTGGSSDPSISYWIEFDRYGDGSAEGTAGVNSDSFSYETDADCGPNLFKVRVVESDPVAMTIIPGNWQDFAFNVAPPANEPPDIDPASIQTSQLPGSSTAGTRRKFSVSGVVIDDDGPLNNRFNGVEIDDDGDGVWDSADLTSLSFTVVSHGNNGLAPSTVRVRAVECSGPMNVQRVVERAGPWHDVTLTPTNYDPFFANTLYTIQVDPFVGAEYVLPPEAFDCDMDQSTYSISASFVDMFDPWERRIRVTNEVAMRQAIASGATFTLTANDGFSGTGTTQIKFELAPGCNVYGQAMATAHVAENVLWSDATTSSTMSTLAATTLTLSGETLLSGGTFDPNRFILTRGSSVGWVSGQPDWDVTLTTSAPPNGAVTPANGLVITTSPDGLTQSASLTTTETVTIVDNSFWGGGALVATMVYSVTVTISTDGTTSAGRSLVSFVPMAAYNPYTVRRSTGIFTWMDGAATLAGSLTN